LGDLVSQIETSECIDYNIDTLTQLGNMDGWLKNEKMHWEQYAGMGL
jgi:hypothetical protein